MIKRVKKSLIYLNPLFIYMYNEQQTEHKVNAPYWMYILQ